MASKMSRIDTRKMERKQWLSIRRKTIGGSEAAAIVGLSSYSTPYAVWANKTGRVPDAEDNEAMRQGRDLEEYVAQRWMEATGKTVRRSNVILYNSQYPFAHADIDRSVMGEKAGLECKTTSTLDIKQFHGVDFPEKYYVQCVHYLAITGFQRWYLAVLVYGKGFFHFTLERNQAEIDALMEAEERFWDHVVTDTPPALDGYKPTSNTMLALYPNSTAGDIQLFGREAMLNRYMALRAEQKVLEEKIGKIENTIKADMQNCEKGSCGAFCVSWKSQTRRTFQAGAFAEQYPDIDLAPFYKATTSRPFKVTQSKAVQPMQSAG